MPCGPNCVTIGADYECLAVVAPDRYAHFRKWCAGDVPSQRMLVRDMSRMGLAAIDAMNPKTPPPIDDAPATPPTLLHKAASLGKAIVDHVESGFAMADEETYKARWDTCLACEKYDATTKTCMACGCFLAVKIRMATARCPIGKW